MNAHITHDGLSVQSLRGTMHLSQRPVRPASATQVAPPATAHWLERLALWAERQPVHRRMGSYTQLR